MEALEYMEKQLNKHKANHAREYSRGVPEKMLNDIQSKIGYYEKAVEALKFVGRIKEVKM